MFLVTLLLPPYYWAVIELNLIEQLSRSISKADIIV